MCESKTYAENFSRYVFESVHNCDTICGLETDSHDTKQNKQIILQVKLVTSLSYRILFTYSFTT